MDFQLSEDQQALQSGVRAFCDGRVPFSLFAELERTNAFDRSLWKELAELGVFALRLPDDSGGLGLGAADAVLVFAELGRRLVPGPLVFSQLAAGWVDGVAGGETVVGGLDLCGAETTPTLIEHLVSLDALLVLRPSGVDHLDPRKLDATAVAAPLDPLTPLHLVEHLPAGERIAGPEEATRLRALGAALTAAQMLGIAEATLQLAVDYAKQREQFGRVIGGFQAIKHILADMFVRQEVARAAVYAAGATIDDPEVGDVGRAVSSAKLNAGVAAMANSRACIQVHGGMGYTWEVPAHYYLKRTWVLESVFGNIAEHEALIAECIDRGI